MRTPGWNTVEVFEKIENSLTRLLDEQEISDSNFKNISTELNQKEQALAKLEESRNKLKNDLDRVDTELAEKRFHLSKYSTNNQLYQFRVTFILSSGTWSHCTTNHGTRSILWNQCYKYSINWEIANAVLSDSMRSLQCYQLVLPPIYWPYYTAKK